MYRCTPYILLPPSYYPSPSYFFRFCPIVLLLIFLPPQKTRKISLDLRLPKMTWTADRQTHTWAAVALSGGPYFGLPANSIQKGVRFVRNARRHCPKKDRVHATRARIWSAPAIAPASPRSAPVPPRLAMRALAGRCLKCVCSACGPLRRAWSRDHASTLDTRHSHS